MMLERGLLLRLTISAWFTLALFACEGGGEQSPLPGARAATILGVSKVEAPIDEATGLVADCSYEASETEFTTDILLDTAFAQQLTLPFTVRNDAARESDGIRPLRMRVSWECDSSGFSGDMGPLVVPVFDPLLPFCKSADLEGETAVGPETVPVSGPRIAGGGGLEVAFAQVVPFALGSGIEQTFRIAALAEMCCFETRASNCDGQSTSDACNTLAQVFKDLDPSGTTLEVAVESGPSEDLVRFQPFAIFNGTSFCGRDRTACDANSLRGPAYRMRLRGDMEFLGSDGGLVQSDEVTTDIDFCSTCGYWNGQNRWPWSTGALQCFAR